jgi:Chaperone of endosialidase
LAANQVKLAYSLNDAIAQNEIKGINDRGGILTLVSSVTDKKPGEIGSPIQYDDANGQWYVLSRNDSSNKIYSAIVGFGTTALGNESSSTYVKRKLDNRSIQDRIYRLRYVVPKEYTNARPPQAGFVLQESKTVGISPISFDYTQSITQQTPPAYLRNEKIIKNATVGAVSGGKQTVTITTEKPHKFFVGDKVKIQRIKSENNSSATGITSTYNGSYVITSVPSSKTFTYEISGVKINPGAFTNQIDERDTSQERSQIPLVSREEYKNDFYIYRVDTIKSHIPGLNGQDGIYHLIVLSSNVSPSSDIGYNLSSKAFNQDVRNLYPQIDLDNFNSDPSESVSYAYSPVIGKVITDDKRKSITRETINTFLKNANVGFAITGVTVSGTGYTTVTLHTNVEHNFNSIKSISIKDPTGAGTSGAGYGNTTIYSSGLIGGSGQGASLFVPVVGSTGTINANSIKIVDAGSVYSVGDVLDVSGPSGITPTIYAKAEVIEINNNIGDALEIRGFNTTDLDGVYKITNVPSSKSIEIYVPNGVPSYKSNTNGRNPLATLASKGIGINSFTFNDVNTGIVTVTTNISHGLLRGNKFTIVGSGHTIYDKTFVVKENVGLNTFTFNVGVVTQTANSTTGTLLKHSLSSNELILSRGEDTLGSRASYFYAGITTTISSALNLSDTTITLTSSKGFDRGDYIVINNEIIRLANSTSTNQFNVIRGKFSTFKTTAEAGTQVKKINVMPMEVRRPSFMRASGHTFEYLGYGPGNYSTGMPQKQTRILTEDDVLVSQARKQKGGVVVYTGMNDVGEFYSGAKKLSSSTGEEKIVEAPILSYTGDDAEGTNTNKLDATFDNILARGRITVEGGDGAKETSQFYGPVSFNKKVVSTSDEGVNVKNLYVKGDTTTYKLITVGLSTPTDANLVNRGNISLKSLPNEGYIGQVYVDGEWKKYGPISQSKDILDFKVDKIGIGNSNEFANTVDPGVNNAIFYVGGKSKFKDVVFSGQVEIESGITLNNVNFNNINIRKTAFFSGAGAGGTSYAIYVHSPGDLVNSQTVPRLRSRFYDLEVAGVSTFSNNAIFNGFVGIGTTTNPSEKLSVYGAIESINDDNNEGGQFILRGKPETAYRWNINNYSSGITTNLFRIFKEDNSTAGTNSRVYVGITTIGEFIIGDSSSNLSPTGTSNQQLQVQSSAYIQNNLGIGFTNPLSKLVVNGTIGINASDDTLIAGRTQLSSSATGFIINHVDNSDIIFQNQVTERFRIGAARTATYTSYSSGSDLSGSHFKLKNDGPGDVVLSWFTDDLNNRRWYAGIDASDSYSWKLASTNSAVPQGQERFDSVGENTARNQIETKLKVNQDGDLSILGSLTLNGLNTPSRFEVGSVGVSTIRGSLNLFNLVNNSGQTVTVSDFKINTDKFTVAGNTGNVTTKGTIVSDGTLTVNSGGNSSFGGALGVVGNVTASGFVVNGNPSTSGISNILRANGTNSALQLQDISNALGYIPQTPITIAESNLPKGNSLLLKDITLLFNSTSTSFQLKSPDDQNFTPLGPDNLIVSLGGVIQKPSTDYTIRQVKVSGLGEEDRYAYTNIIDFVEAPPAGTPCFILALGGQGSLTANQDWNAKGEILVGTADNQATNLSVGNNGTILTADNTTTTGVAWKQADFFNNLGWAAKGDLIVGTAEDTAKLLSVGADGTVLTADSNSDTGVSWKNAASIRTQSTSTNANHFLTFVDSNNETSNNETLYTGEGIYYNPSSKSLFVRGDITAFAAAASDDRLKTNKKVIPNALEKIISLNGFTFTWNTKASELGFDTNTIQVGVSAQKVQSVLPEAVKTQILNNEEILTVKYEKLVPLLIEAIKDLKSEIDKLKGDN